MTAAGPLASSVRTQLEKILASRMFADSQRQSCFLRFAVEEALRDGGSKLKEYVIGVEVFGKPESFDPRIDSCVRVEAHRLRAKLREYYQAEGRDDPVEIRFLKRGYLPVFRRREGTDGRWKESRPTPQGAGAGRSVALLPFTCLSDELDDEYFSDGLTEELIRTLSGVQGLRVLTWNSGLPFRGRAAELDEIRKRLGVAAVLQGSVRRARGRLRVAAKLISVEDGGCLWSERYERDSEDAFAVQDEIARVIGKAMSLRLPDPAERPLTRRCLDSPQAYQLYLRGRHHWGRRTAEELQRAAELFQQALATDPTYAPAHAGLADSYALLTYYGPYPPGKLMPKARAAAERALELDSRLGEAHATLGWIRSVYDWDLAGAEGEFQQALALNPGYATAHLWYADACLAPMERLEEAMAHLECAQELDPLSLTIPISLGAMFCQAGQPERGVEQYEQALELQPNFYLAHWNLGLLLEQQSMPDKAVAAFQLARAFSGDAPFLLAAVGHAYGLLGKRDEANELLRELEKISRWRFVSPWNLGTVHLGLGEINRAFECLERACQFRCSDLIWLKRDPRTKPLHKDRRFQSLLSRLGLPG
jgi:serine/threonine-protein kinase